MNKKMQALVEAPLRDPAKLYLPEGRRRAPRSHKPQYGDDVGGDKLTTKQLAERKEKALGKKLEALLDYYAGTDLPADRVAEHLGLYRSEQIGVDDDGKPIMRRVLDVKRAEDQLSWRRALKHTPKVWG